MNSSPDIFFSSSRIDSTVDPAMAFTISKADLNINPTNASIVLEQNPPSYSSSISPPPPPPPYASIQA